MTAVTVKKVVLAYSGGLDTSVIVPWLKNNYGDCEVICYTADLGQEEELSGLEEKALASGASKLIIDDLREEFLRDYVFPTMQAGRRLRARLPAGHLHGSSADRQKAWSMSPKPKGPMPSPTAAPAKATTRFASN